MCSELIGRYALAACLVAAFSGSSVPKAAIAQTVLTGKVAEMAELAELGGGALINPLKMSAIVGIDPNSVFYGDPVSFSLDVAGMQVPAGKGVVLWYNEQGIAALVTEGNPVVDVKAEISQRRSSAEQRCASAEDEEALFHYVDTTADQSIEYEFGEGTRTEPSMVVTYLLQMVCPPNGNRAVALKIVGQDKRYLVGSAIPLYLDDKGHFRDGSIFAFQGTDTFLVEDQITFPYAAVDGFRPGERYYLEFSLHQVQQTAEGGFFPVRQVGRSSYFAIQR